MAPSFLTTLFIAAAFAGQTSAKPEFRQLIPNAMNVKGVEAIGHVDPEGGGARNAFGMDFAANGLAWTKELCEKDSDGDGQTNGQELGDPCCEWVKGSKEKVQWTTGVSAPGDAKSKSDPSLWKDVKCASANSTSSSSSSGTETVSTPSTTTKAPAESSSEKPAATTAATTTPVPSTTKKSAATSATVAIAVSATALTLALFV